MSSDMNLKIPQKPQISKGAEMGYKMDNLEQESSVDSHHAYGEDPSLEDVADIEEVPDQHYTSVHIEVQRV